MRKSREEKDMYQDHDRRSKEQLDRGTKYNPHAGTRVLLRARTRRRCCRSASPRRRRVCANPARVAEWLVPEEPCLGWVVRLSVGKEPGVRALRVAEYRRACPDTGVELGRSLVSRRDHHREVERSFDRAPRSSCQVPSIKADMRAQACVSLDRQSGSSLGDDISRRQARETGLTIMAARL